MPNSYNVRLCELLFLFELGCCSVSNECDSSFFAFIRSISARNMRSNLLYCTLQMFLVPFGSLAQFGSWPVLVRRCKFPTPNPPLFTRSWCRRSVLQVLTELLNVLRGQLPVQDALFWRFSEISKFANHNGEAGTESFCGGRNGMRCCIILIHAGLTKKWPWMFLGEAEECRGSRRFRLENEPPRLALGWRSLDSEHNVLLQ